MPNNMLRLATAPSAISLTVFTRSAGVAGYIETAARRAGIGAVRLAATAEEAAALVAQGAQDVMILHAVMSRPDLVLEARRVSRARRADRRRTPMILAIAAPTTQHLRMAQHFGFADLLLLPASPVILWGRIETAVEALA